MEIRTAAQLIPVSEIPESVIWRNNDEYQENCSDCKCDEEDVKEMYLLYDGISHYDSEGTILCDKCVKKYLRTMKRFLDRLEHDQEPDRTVTSLLYHSST